MKVALSLDRQTDEQVVAGADAFWLIGSPENRKLAARLRQTDTFDPNSAVFDGDRYVGAEDAAVGVLGIIAEHHPQWTEVEVVGVELSPLLMMTLQGAGWAAETHSRGFVVTRAS